MNLLDDLFSFIAELCYALSPCSTTRKLLLFMGLVVLTAAIVLYCCR